MFGRGMIVNNKIASRHNQDTFSWMVEKTKKRHEEIHAGLIAVLFKFDKNAQDFLNECSSYPSKSMCLSSKALSQKSVSGFIQRKSQHSYFVQF